MPWFNSSPIVRVHPSLNWACIGSGNRLLPVRCQVITWPQNDLWSIDCLITHFSEILIKIQHFPFTKMHLIISSTDWRPFHPGEMSWQQNIFSHTMQSAVKIQLNNKQFDFTISFNNTFWNFNGDTRINTLICWKWLGTFHRQQYFQGCYHFLVNLWKLCVYNILLLASRKFCYQSPDSNLRVKTKWQECLTQGGVSCHLVA